MAIALTNTGKAAAMNAIADELNGGKLKIGTTSMASTLVTLTLTNPSESDVTNGVLTFDADPDLSTTASATGTAAEATLTKSDDTVIFSGLTVGTSGSDVNLDSTSITSGQTVTIATASVTMG